MKKNLSQMLTAIFSCGVMLLACGFMMTTMTACGSDDDEPAGNGIDDLAYLQKRIANEGSLVYGVQLGTDTKDIVSRPVATTASAQEEFDKLIAGGSAHQGLSTAKNGTITYQPSQSATVYYCAEVAFSPEVKSATGISCLRYVLIDRWPEDGNGFIKDILDHIKQ